MARESPPVVSQEHCPMVAEEAEGGGAVSQSPFPRTCTPQAMAPGPEETLGVRRCAFVRGTAGLWAAKAAASTLSCCRYPHRSWLRHNARSLSVIVPRTEESHADRGDLNPTCCARDSNRGQERSERAHNSAFFAPESLSARTTGIDSPAASVPEFVLCGQTRGEKKEKKQ